MTVIIGIKDSDGCVWMGADKKSTMNDESFSTVCTDSKIWRMGEYIVGIAGSGRLGQVIRHNTKLPQSNKIKTDTDKHKVIAKIVNQLENSLYEHGVMTEENNYRIFDGQIMVGWENNLYTIYGDLQYGQSIDGVETIGSGFTSALISLRTARLMKDKATIEEKMVRTLRLVSEIDPHVGPPFNIMNTNGYEIEIEK